jgi:hypothetical protein
MAGMKGEYASDREWSDQYVAEIQSILEQVVRERIKIVVRPADFVLDTTRATDLISGAVGPIAFASRLRRPEVFRGRSSTSHTHWGLQFTVRSRRDSGTETELAKFKKGFGDWYLYGHVEEGIRHWVVLDLSVYRKHLEDPDVRLEVQNNQDGTHFIAYDILSFPPELVIATSPTMALALKQGVNAVERAPSKAQQQSDERWHQRLLSDPPPDLQELVLKHGGYSSIPATAWKEWDQLNADWQIRRKSTY